MDVTVFKVQQVELVGRSPDVAFIVSVSSEMKTVHDLGKSKHSNVKLTQRGIVPMRTTDQDWI
jgi:hypothetical protein